MSSDRKYWSKNNSGVFFLKRPFKFTEASMVSGGNNDGINALVQKQHELKEALYGRGLDKIRPTQILTSVVDLLSKMMKEDNQFKELTSAKHRILIKGAVKELSEIMGIETTPAIFTLIDMVQAQEKVKPDQASNTSSEKPSQLSQPSASPKPAEAPKEKTQPISLPREFTIAMNGDDYSEAEITFTGETIQLDADEQSLLALILERAASGSSKPITNNTLAHMLALEPKDLATLYPSMKKDMERAANGSSNALKYDAKNKAHSVKVPVINMADKKEPANAANVELILTELNDAFGG